MISCSHCGARLGKGYNFCAVCGADNRRERYSTAIDGYSKVKEGEIGITPMSLKNGVLGIPIALCQNWNAEKSVCGTLNYADIVAPITFSPKHTFFTEKGLTRAKAWQFSVNNNSQFAQLRLDGVNTFIANKKIGEALLCEIEYRYANGEETAVIQVLDVRRAADGPATDVVRKLLRQQILGAYVKDTQSGGVHWGKSTGWIDIADIDQYADVSRCLYMWWGSSVDGSAQRYLYIGIVGDIRGKKKQESGLSKRTLAKRIREEMRDYAKRGIRIEQFRYDALMSSDYGDTAELLKTAEMRAITAMSAVLPCVNAQKQIKPILPDCELELINMRTSYHSK